MLVYFLQWQCGHSYPITQGFRGCGYYCALTIQDYDRDQGGCMCNVAKSQCS